MHDMLERRVSHQAQVHALKMRTDELERRAPQNTPATTKSREIVTKTVVVKVPPSTVPSTTARPATTTSPATSVRATTSGTTSSTTPTSASTTSRATSSTSTTTTSKPNTTSTNRNVAPPSTLSSSTPKAASTVLSPTVDSDSSNAKASGGLSSGATGGIVAGVVLVALILVLFVIRKMFIHRRERKRNTWGAGLYPTYDDKDATTGERQGLTAKDPVPTPITSSSFGVTGAGFGTGMTPRTSDWRDDQLASRTSMAATPSFFITPPPASYNNAVAEDAYGGLAAAASASSGVETAIVNKMYIPTLADELSVTVGEVVQVLRAFDDGWALCQSNRGDKGVVPLQCLDWAQNANPGTGVQQTHVAPPSGYGQDASNGDWRNTKRLSSLSGHGPLY